MCRDVDERELIRLCSERDRCAEDELYSRYAARLFSLCRRYSGNDDDAKDLMQDSFVRAFDRIQDFNYSGKGSFYAWLSRIAINLSVNSIKRYKLRFLSMTRFTSDMLQEPSDDEVKQLDQEEILAIISHLPTTQRTVFNMFCIDDFSHKEIAEALGISEKGSASLLSKAREKLKSEIRECLKKKD